MKEGKFIVVGDSQPVPPLQRVITPTGKRGQSVPQAQQATKPAAPSKPAASKGATPSPAGGTPIRKK
jgi:hypothetical protein